MEPRQGGHALGQGPRRRGGARPRDGRRPVHLKTVFDARAGGKDQAAARRLTRGWCSAMRAHGAGLVSPAQDSLAIVAPRDGSAWGFLAIDDREGSDQMADATTKKGMFEEQSVRSFRTEERRVIFASSLGTVFEWYDFYLYAVLAPFFAALFFPPGNQTAALLSAFAAYAAGFLVRPFGALVFGRIGDLVGRKYTFLVTILFMGASTFLVGLLPTFATVGWLA